VREWVREHLAIPDAVARGDPTATARIMGEQSRQRFTELATASPTLSDSGLCYR